MITPLLLSIILSIKSHYIKKKKIFSRCRGIFGKTHGHTSPVMVTLWLIWTEMKMRRPSRYTLIEGRNVGAFHAFQYPFHFERVSTPARIGYHSYTLYFAPLFQAYQRIQLVYPNCARLPSLAVLPFVVLEYAEYSP